MKNYDTSIFGSCFITGETIQNTCKENPSLAINFYDERKKSQDRCFSVCTVDNKIISTEVNGKAEYIGETPVKDKIVCETIFMITDDYCVPIGVYNNL